MRERPLPEIDVVPAQQVWAVRPPIGNHILLGIDTGDRPTLVFAANAAMIRRLRADIDEVLRSDSGRRSDGTAPRPRRNRRPG